MNDELHDDDSALTALLQRDALDDLPDGGFSDAVMRALPPATLAGAPRPRPARTGPLRWTLPLALGTACAGFVACSPALLGAMQGRAPVEQGLPGLVLFALVAAWSWWGAVGDPG